MTKKRVKFAKIDSSFLFILTGRFTLFLFLEVTALFMLFISGNFQSFSDLSQRFLLLMISVLSIALALLAVTGFIESIVLLFVRRKKSMFAFIAMFLSCAVYALVIMIVIGIITWLSGGM